MEPCHPGCCETLNEPAMNLGLCAVQPARIDPFTKKRMGIHAPTEEFLKEYGFTG